MTVEKLISILSSFPANAEVEIAVRSRVDKNKYLRRKVVEVTTKQGNGKTTVSLVALKSLIEQHRLSAGDILPASAGDEWPFDFKGIEDFFEHKAGILF